MHMQFFIRGRSYVVYTFVQKLKQSPDKAKSSILKPNPLLPTQKPDSEDQSHADDYMPMITEDELLANKTYVRTQ